VLDILLVKLVIILCAYLIWLNDSFFALAEAESSLVNAGKFVAPLGQILTNEGIPATIVAIAMDVKYDSFGLGNIRSIMEMVEPQRPIGRANHELKGIDLCPLKSWVLKGYILAQELHVSLTSIVNSLDWDVMEPF
jgi:hypothetical protein